MNMLTQNMQNKGLPVEMGLPEGLPPLMWAAANGDLYTVQQLILNSIVDINEKGPHGWTALIFAAAMGHYMVVKYLLNQGARLKAEDKVGRNALRSALHAIWPKRYTALSQEPI